MQLKLSETWQRQSGVELLGIPVAQPTCYFKHLDLCDDQRNIVYTNKVRGWATSRCNWMPLSRQITKVWSPAATGWQSLKQLNIVDIKASVRAQFNAKARSRVKWFLILVEMLQHPAKKIRQQSIWPARVDLTCLAPIWPGGCGTPKLVANLPSPASSKLY